ncbi:MAG: hypothetical protein M3081_13850 [Gemmatimonadota bacterium]|nr:hypothetical protein [Gemmatimonadota bacterium]
MIPPEVIVVPAVFGIPAAVLYARMKFRHTEKMATIEAGMKTSPEIEARLTRVEQAVDAVAIEVERVGEGQRYLTKLLAERNPQR